MISSSTETFQTFAFFNLYLPAVSLGLCLIPVSKCLWSNFREEKGKVTGIVTFAFGISSFAYILFSTYYLNYNNVSPTKEYNEGTQKILYFGKEITDNVKGLVFWMGLSSLILMVPGIFMVKDNTANEENTDIELKEMEKKAIIDPEN
jgi:hypothetical protein